MHTDFISPVTIDKAYRLLNHGPTVLVSAQHHGTADVMAAAWSCVLDYGDTPRVTVVLDKSTYTRTLVEASGYFALQLPCTAQASMVYALGTHSAHTQPDKLQLHGVQLFTPTACPVPLVHGCVGWLVCQLRPEPHNQQTYDLFIGDVIAAWADTRVYRDNHWHFDDAPDSLRTLHHVAGGQFLVTGRALDSTKG